MNSTTVHDAIVFSRSESSHISAVREQVVHAHDRLREARGNLRAVDGRPSILLGEPTADDLNAMEVARDELARAELELIRASERLLAVNVINAQVGLDDVNVRVRRLEIAVFVLLVIVVAMALL